MDSKVIKSKWEITVYVIFLNATKDRAYFEDIEQIVKGTVTFSRFLLSMIYFFTLDFAFCLN